MTTWLPRWIACLILVFSFVPVVAAAPDDAEIARLVKQLGHDEFATREDATTRLKEIGEPALDALTKAATSNDPEVRRRAEELVAVIEKKLYGEQLRFTGHTAIVRCVCVSADGKRVLTSSEDKTLRLWDADTGKELRVFEGHTERVIGAALSPDGKRLLSGSDDKTVRLWDVTTGKELQKMTGHTEAVWSVAFGPEGQALSGGVDRTMRLWDLNTGKNVGVFTGHTAPVYPVVYSDKAKLAATGSQDQSIRLWNLETGKEVRTLTGHSGNYGRDLDVSFSSDGKRLVSCSHTDNTVRLWDVEMGKELKRITAPNPHCVAFSPDGKRLVSGGDDHTVRVWDAETGKQLRKYEGHTGCVLRVTFFPDGKRIASASEDGTARIWSWPVSSRTQAADSKDSKLKDLLKERLATLKEVADLTTKTYNLGEPSVSYAQVVEANKAVRNAELDLCDTDKERIAVLEKMLAEAKEAEKLAEQLVKQKVAPTSTALQAKANRLEVEIALERLKSK